MKALLIGNSRFMENFHPEWKGQFVLEEYDPKMGEKDRLEKLKEIQCYDAVFVDDENVNYSADILFCWLRLLKSRGMLALRARPDQSAEALCQEFRQVVSYKANDNCNVWLYEKDLGRLGKDEIHTYVDLNNALLNKDFPKALKAAENMTFFEPQHWISFFVQIKIYQEMGVPNQEDRIFERFLRYENSVNHHILGSLDLLMGGDYLQGFKRREKLCEFVDSVLPERRCALPPKGEWFFAKRWLGESLEGKHLVIWSEFGLGDEIMFAQLAHYLKTLGTQKITLVAQKPILTLLETHPDIDEVICREEANDVLGEFDYWVYPHAILAYVTEAFQIQPKRHPYLFANKEKQTQFCDLITKNDRLKVGVVWRGNPTHENDENRSVHNLSAIEKLFSTQGMEFYCLQKERNEKEKALLEKYNVIDLSPQLQDMADTAAAISLLDCVVTVDTSVAHVAGALGKQTFLMLPYMVDWRWGAYQRDNLWYPKMVSLRWRAMVEDWHYVIDCVQKELADFKPEN